jgi:transcriptional regulator with XRE-family HTH domain
MKKLTDIHKGEEIEKLRKKRGIPLATFARRAELSPPTLKKHIENPDLSEKMFLRLGLLLNHDFSTEYPELIPIKESIGIRNADNKQDTLLLYRRYQALLQRHTDLVRLLARIATKYDLREFSDAIDVVCMADSEWVATKGPLVDL